MMAAARLSTRTRMDLSPIVYAAETTESWISYKVVYFIDNYGTQFGAGDEIIHLVLQHLEQAGIKTANNRMLLQGANDDRAACNPLS